MNGNVEVTQQLERLQLLVDELEIRRVITDYASLIDAREFDRLHSVFAPDVVVDYHNGRTQVVGARSVVDYIVENTRHLAWQHHNVSPYGIDVTGDRASAQVYLLSHQMLTDSPDEVLMMASTYDLELTRGEQGWRILHMTHSIKVANYVPITTTPAGGAHVPPAVRH
jgi:ketosteroid isomerase-like protein